MNPHSLFYLPSQFTVSTIIKEHFVQLNKQPSSKRKRVNRLDDDHGLLVNNLLVYGDDTLYLKLYKVVH